MNCLNPILIRYFDLTHFHPRAGFGVMVTESQRADFIVYRSRQAWQVVFNNRLFFMGKHRLALLEMLAVEAALIFLNAAVVEPTVEKCGAGAIWKWQL